MHETVIGAVSGLCGPLAALGAALAVLAAARSVARFAAVRGREKLRNIA